MGNCGYIIPLIISVTRK